MIFEKASTRTRLSFEAGMQQLGGSAIYLNTRDSQLQRGESVEDAAQVISRMSDVVMIRTFEQAIIERFAAHSRVPVINGLTNEYHPCQIMADIFTYHRASRPDSGKDGRLDRRFEQCLQHLAAGRRGARFQDSGVDAAGL
jgi:ornithine carbamoyltransferase